LKIRSDTEANVKSTRTRRTIRHVTLSWLKYPELTETAAQVRPSASTEVSQEPQGVL